LNMRPTKKQQHLKPFTNIKAKNKASIATNNRPQGQERAPK